MICLKCGALLPENTKFCPNCGQPVKPLDFDGTVVLDEENTSVLNDAFENTTVLNEENTSVLNEENTSVLNDAFENTSVLNEENTSVLNEDTSVLNEQQYQNVPPVENTSYPNEQQYQNIPPVPPVNNVYAAPEQGAYPNVNPNAAYANQPYYAPQQPAPAKKKLSTGAIVAIVAIPVFLFVILPIIIAICVPIFSATTKNAKRKACASNVRIIEGNLSTYLATGNDGEAFTNYWEFALMNDFNGMPTSSEFTDLFKGGEIPECESTDYPYEYIVKYDIDVYSGTLNSFSVYCTNPECPNYSYVYDY